MSHWETSGASDEWFTPASVFAALGEQFDLDVAHPRDHRTNVPCNLQIWRDSLAKGWSGFVWMNPPFGGRNSLAPWLDKFFAHGNGIALTPDRTSAPWFQDAWRKADAVLFTRKIRFIRPDGSEGKSPSNGTALFASGKRAVAALRRAEAKGLGIYAQVAKPTVKPSLFAALDELRNYADHLPDCPGNHDGTCECDFNLAIWEARAALGRAQGEA